MATVPVRDVRHDRCRHPQGHTHLAVALDELGRWLDAIEIPTTAAGYAELLGPRPDPDGVLILV